MSSSVWSCNTEFVNNITNTQIALSVALWQWEISTGLHYLPDVLFQKDGSIEIAANYVKQPAVTISKVECLVDEDQKFFSSLGRIALGYILVERGPDWSTVDSITHKQVF